MLIATFASITFCVGIEAVVYIHFVTCFYARIVWLSFLMKSSTSFIVLQVAARLNWLLGSGEGRCPRTFTILLFAAISIVHLLIQLKIGPYSLSVALLAAQQHMIVYLTLHRWHLFCCYEAEDLEVLCLHTVSGSVLTSCRIHSYLFRS